MGSQFEIKHLQAAFERTSVMTHFGQRRGGDICPGCPLKSWRRTLLWPFSVQAVDHQSKCKAPSVHCFALPSSRAQIYHISEISSLISIPSYCPYPLPVKVQASLISLFLAPAIIKSTRSHSSTKNISQQSSPQIYHISLGGIIFHHKSYIQQSSLSLIVSHLICLPL